MGPYSFPSSSKLWGRCGAAPGFAYSSAQCLQDGAKWTLVSILSLVTADREAKILLGHLADAQNATPNVLNLEP